MNTHAHLMFQFFWKGSLFYLPSVYGHSDESSRERKSHSADGSANEFRTVDEQKKIKLKNHVGKLISFVFLFFRSCQLTWIWNREYPVTWLRWHHQKCQHWPQHICQHHCCHHCHRCHHRVTIIIIIVTTAAWRCRRMHLQRHQQHFAVPVVDQSAISTLCESSTHFITNDVCNVSRVRCIWCTRVSHETENCTVASTTKGNTKQKGTIYRMNAGQRNRIECSRKCVLPVVSVHKSVCCIFIFTRIQFWNPKTLLHFSVTSFHLSRLSTEKMQPVWRRPREKWRRQTFDWWWNTCSSQHQSPYKYVIWE